VRSLPLLLLAALATGCASGRDYLSVNKSSFEFLVDTAREGHKLRKKNLAMDVDFGPRIHESLVQQRKGRSFAVESFWKDQLTEANNASRALVRELSFDSNEFWRSVRFGHLDGGD